MVPDGLDAYFSDSSLLGTSGHLHQTSSNSHVRGRRFRGIYINTGILLRAYSAMATQRTDPHAIRVFISYSRRDLEIAGRLVDALEREGFAVTIDRRDLPYGEEWLKELADFIAGADTVVALVSPAFIASKACNWELGQVKATNKRLVPVVIGPVSIEELPESIGKIHLLPATGTFDFEVHLKPLVEALNTDRQWIKEHTRLADQARQWILRGRAPALLLRGTALTDAESWQDRQPECRPSA